MMNLARSELYLGRVETVEKTLKRVEAVDLDELKRVCSKYLTPASLSLSVIAPRGSLGARDLKKVNFSRG
jgi:predicted Zn-dependent peptidase